MPARVCQNCKHFEPSPIRHKGWCRNPLLYAPQQSHLVDQHSLDCARRYGSFWEPANGVADESVTGTSGETFSNKSRIRLFQLPPQLIAVPAGAIASSTGGGNTDRGDRETSRPARFGGGGGGGRGNQPPPPGGPRVNRTGLPQGQERTVSYQPEERYWTDYLRIALPVVGLLLMLGLFWYWASAVIGDDNNNGPPANATNTVTLLTEPTLTPTQTVAVDIAAETVTTEPTPDSGNQPEDQPTDEPTSPAEETPEALGKGFQEGDSVVTNDSVNMRAEGSTEAEVIEELPADTLLEVLSPATEEVNSYFWVEVQAPDGQTGYVADEFLDPAE